MAYIDSEKLYAMIDPGQRDRLFIADHKGKPKGTRTIQYLNGFFPVHVEGLAYIPESSPFFPDHLVLMAIEDDFVTGRIEVIRRDGEVVAEILPALPADQGFAGGLAFKAPDKLIVGLGGGIYTLDFNGNIISGPVPVPDTQFIEGLVQTRDGRIVSTGQLARLRFFDQNLNRLPRDDKDFQLGLGFIQAAGVAWNPDTNQHLVNVTADGTVNTRQVVGVSSTLDSASQVVDLAGSGFFNSNRLSYLPDEHLIAVANATSPRRILLFDNGGALADEVIISLTNNINGVEYIPTTAQFAVRLGGQPSRVKIYSRAGVFAREFDLAPYGVTAAVAFAYFNPGHASGGQFLIIADQTRALITDFNGNLLGEFNIREKLGLLRPSGVAAITTGNQAGAFSMVDSDNNEIVIFRLD
jgi:hypothetical protein